MYVLELDVLGCFFTWYIKHAIIPVFTAFIGFLLSLSNYVALTYN